MKKKLLAVVLAMAMTLGMGAVASAEEASTAEPFFKVGTVEEAKAGDTIEVNVYAGETTILAAFELNAKIDTTKVEFAQKNPAKMIKSYPGTIVANYVEEKSLAIVTSAFAANPDFYEGEADVKAGDLFATIQLTVKEDLAPGTEFITVSTKLVTGAKIDGTEYTDFGLTTGDVVVEVVAKATEAPTEAPTQAPTNGTQAPTQAPTNGTQATQATTTKALTKADAMNAVTDLSKAVALADKLSKDAFANASDYEAFAKALANAKAVLANAKATDAEKAAALDALKTLIAKADDAAVVKAATDAGLVGTTTAATTAKVDNTKTGDASNALALMIVAIAAFGTAVVVYRKKVNA